MFLETATRAFVFWFFLALIGVFLCFFLFFAESPAEFFAENKNIAGFDNVSSSSSSVLSMISFGLCVLLIFLAVWSLYFHLENFKSTYKLGSVFLIKLSFFFLSISPPAWKIIIHNRERTCGKCS